MKPTPIALSNMASPPPPSSGGLSTVDYGSGSASSSGAAEPSYPPPPAHRRHPAPSPPPAHPHATHTATPATAAASGTSSKNNSSSGGGSGAASWLSSMLGSLPMGMPASRRGSANKGRSSRSGSRRPSKDGGSVAAGSGSPALAIGMTGDPSLDEYKTSLDAMTDEVADIRTRLEGFARAICGMADQATQVALVARHVCAEAQVRENHSKGYVCKQRRESTITAACAIFVVHGSTVSRLLFSYVAALCFCSLPAVLAGIDWRFC